MGEESENSPFFEKLVIRISFLIVTKTTSIDGRRYIYQISDYPCITGLNLYPYTSIPFSSQFERMRWVTISTPACTFHLSASGYYLQVASGADTRGSEKVPVRVCLILGQVSVSVVVHLIIPFPSSFMVTV
jgi:hypothetical protein